ncbi:MAG: hypothetical protein Q9165_006810 [Trypethelium subeluteriae]
MSPGPQQDLLMSASDAISSDDLKGFLRKLLGSPLDDNDTAPRRLRNQDYQSISEYLQMAGKRSWADRPRTFTVLYMIGHVEAMDGFVAEDLSDIALPYSDGNLPNVFSKQARSQFLRYQSNVLDEVAAEIAGDLEEGGQHRNLDGTAETYFRRVRRLGEGGFATVDEVVGNLSSKHFALKRMPRHTFFETDRSRLEAFQNELQSLKRLSHKHIVQLVGSFTDLEGIGLLMTPVAKQNLAEFMTARLDEYGQEDRKFLLRNFFGCIATAVDYLHSQNIRHKDIKPQNILVKDTKVYITDFGTSRMWIKDDTDTTEGTVSAFTQRYSAPEVIYSQKRNKSADIWSLGCVFLEMAVVLAGRTLRDMKTFFSTNGSKREFIYSNPDALSLWIQELRSTMVDSAADYTLERSQPPDYQPLDLVRRMCDRDPDRRISSETLVRTIFDFSAPPHYVGQCCRNFKIRVSLDSLDGEPEKWNEERTPVLHYLEDHNKADDLQQVRDARTSNYLPPSVEDADLTTTTLVAEPECLPEGAGVLVSSTSDDEGSAPNSYPPVPLPTEKETQLRPLNRSEQKSTEHPRTLSTENKLPSRVRGVVERGRMLPPTNLDSIACPWPNCKPPSGLAMLYFDGPQSLRSHIREKHNVHEYSWTRLLDGDSALCLTSETGHFIRVDPKTKHSAFTHGDGVFGRFDEKQRQEHQSPTKGMRTGGQGDLSSMIKVKMPGVIGKEEVAWGSARIPKSSYVPSYVLASMNQFRKAELTETISAIRKPLFVYGSLMFPSILKRHGESLMSSTGIYSSEQRRRIMTDSTDWAKCNLSIERAAECMTPALLKGYQRVKVPGSSLATLQRDSKNPSSIMQGFLIFGLTREALCCLDHLYEKDGPMHLFTEEQEDRENVSKWDHTHSSRRDVRVRIATCGGNKMTVDASAYFPEDEIDPTSVRIGWDPDIFIHSKSFNKLCGAQSRRWMAEEQNIADMLGIRFVLRGDELVKKICDKDMGALRELIQKGFDVNASSVRFGSPLQAAAHYRNEDAAWYLLKKGAEVNAEGGEYGTALVAAVVQGEEGIVRLLLGKKANLFTSVRTYISALYQAVNRQDVDMTRLLLKKGAWLTNNYDELLDLASERGNSEIKRMLEAYDVRGLYLTRGLRNSQSRTRIQGSPSKRKAVQDEARDTDSESSKGSIVAEADRRKIYQAVLGQWLLLKGTEGEWTGLKGVKLLQTCFANGLPEKFLDRDLQLFQRLIKYVPNLRDFSREFSSMLGSKISGSKSEIGDERNKEASEPQKVASTNPRKVGMLDVPGKHTSGRRRARSNPERPAEGESLSNEIDSRASDSTHLKPPETSGRPRSSSLNPPTSYPSNGRSSRDIRREDDESLCLTCDGRGGRRGTSIRCAECKSSGERWSESKNLMRTCRNCRGSGRTYAERDRCKACDGTGRGPD